MVKVVLDRDSAAPGQRPRLSPKGVRRGVSRSRCALMRGLGSQPSTPSRLRSGNEIEGLSRPAIVPPPHRRAWVRERHNKKKPEHRQSGSAQA
jgi:hypothetical protein